MFGGELQFNQKSATDSRPIPLPKPKIDTVTGSPHRATMQPPLPPGTVLQNRYRILSLLGQGGFGRTYLAEDQGRFNERCALKELTPAQGGAYALDKSKELFVREAQVLYQIQHPQVPQFRATFEQDQRLFVVQDYVEGLTYRMMLEQRRAQGLAFSEAEVLQLIRQILPVLAHLHSKGIIHRDITPDNIILRNQDGKPVLIDFGVVKEIATRLQSVAGTVLQSTAVGKLGFAPSEQMQTGKAYPSSDLYSLAVTAVVLLTGREPQELFDDSSMTWHWQRYVNVSNGLAQILNKMLNFRPGDRFQSVAELAQALQFMTTGGTAAIAAQVPPQTPPPLTQSPPAPIPVPAQTDVSHMQTVAVGRRASSPEPAPTRPRPAQIEAPRNSLWDDPLAVIVLGIGLVALTGIGSWLVVRTIMNSQQTPSSPSPIASQTASPTPKPTPSQTPKPTPSQTPTPAPSDPVTYSQRLDLGADQSVAKKGVLRSNETLNYTFSGEQDQKLAATVQGEGVLMTVLAPNGEPVDDRAKRVSAWEGNLPYRGSYSLQLSPVRGLDRVEYSLDASLKSATPPPEPTPTGQPDIEVERVNFPVGESSTTLEGLIRGNTIKRYIVFANERQVLTVEVSQGATIVVRSPGGEPLQGASGVVYSENKLSMTGDYAIDVVASPNTSFTLTVRASPIN